MEPGCLFTCMWWLISGRERYERKGGEEALARQIQNFEHRGASPSSLKINGKGTVTRKIMP